MAEERSLDPDLVALFFEAGCHQLEGQPRKVGA
jgi:hypothetical protein